MPGPSEIVPVHDWNVPGPEPVVVASGEEELVGTTVGHDVVGLSVGQAVRSLVGVAVANVLGENLGGAVEADCP
jgi:hypothetical protein